MYYYRKRGQSRFRPYGPTSRPCEDEAKGALDFYEIKRDKDRISLKELESKAAAFFAKNPDLQGRVVSFKGLSIEEM